MDTVGSAQGTLAGGDARGTSAPDEIALPALSVGRLASGLTQVSTPSLPQD
jgi:hypothetical protein